jgi:hypothetical protein
MWNFCSYIRWVEKSRELVKYAEYVYKDMVCSIEDPCSSIVRGQIKITYIGEVHLIVTILAAFKCRVGVENSVFERRYIGT